MDKEYFLNAGIQPISNWQNLTSPPETQQPNFLLQSNWEKSTDQYTYYESALSSIVSSPVAPNSSVSNDTFTIRELIGKLGTVCNSGDIVVPGNRSANTSCYNTPLNSPPKLHNPVMDHFENLPNLPNSIPLSPNLMSADPGFVERAAMFSCFGSQSFKGPNNPNFQLISNNPLSGKFSRISSTSSIKLAGSSPGLIDNKNYAQDLNSDKKLSRLPASAANSNEDSSVSEQNITGVKAPIDSISRKRKAVSKGKLKEIPTKEEAATDDSNSKRSKQTQNRGNVKAEEETQVEENDGPKIPEPPKDYIHVRARRGQATDSHSLAERVRREKISERMKLLQDLVPGCNKVTGKALMLDEIINYVQSLQRHVEVLSMKWASVNPKMDFNMDIFQENGNLHHPNVPTNSSFYGHHNIPSGSMGPSDATMCHNMGFQSPQANGFVESVPQFTTLFEDDLQSIVQMGLGNNLNYPGATNHKSQMKLEP